MNVMQRLASSMATRPKGRTRSIGIWMLYLVSLPTAARSELQCELEAAEQDFARTRARRAPLSTSAAR